MAPPSDVEVLNAPSVGEHGEPCATCGAPLAGDQRYCLNCGERRADARLPFLEILRAEPPARPPTEPPALPPAAAAPPPGPSWKSPVAVGVGVLAAAVLVGLGLLIGNDDPQQVKIPEQKAPVVNVQAGGGAATEAAFTSDWPDGQEGWTVQLSELPKASTQPPAVAAAKTDATTKGAPEVGALDTAEYAALTPETYVVYSGVYESEKEAKAALKELDTAAFPDAKVVEVSASGSGASSSEGDVSDDDKGTGVQNEKTKALIDDLEKSRGSKDYAKKSAKLPDKLDTGGKPPPKDDKEAGGGSDAEVIG